MANREKEEERDDNLKLETGGESVKGSQADPPPYTIGKIEDDPQEQDSLEPSLTILDSLIFRFPNGPWCDAASDDPAANNPDPAIPLYSLIKEKDNATITYLLEQEYFTANFQDQGGCTPLLAAIEAGSSSGVDLLMRYGANVNDYGVVELINRGHKRKALPVYRTPLQFAAEKGNLVIVKLLLETYHADDALVAPDGQIALRLASANGHREIVDYLPSRRGGGWRRWKAKHEVAMSRAKRAAQSIGSFLRAVLYECPKLLFWDLPYRGIVKPIGKRLAWAWTHRGEIPAAMAKSIGRIGRGIWDAIKCIPDLTKELWKVVRRIPNALLIAGRWLWGGITALGKASSSIIARLFSFLHTLILAIGTWFGNLTLQNVWQGFVYLLRAIFIDGPVNMWNWLQKFGETTYKMLGATLGILGKIAWWIVRALLGVIVFVPVKLWEVIASFGASIGKAFGEVLVWFNPKR